MIEFWAQGYGIKGGAIGNNLGKTHWSLRNTQGSELGAQPTHPPTQALFMGLADN
jgi:hypothetical protein